MTHSIRGLRRPYRSAIQPKTSAPTGRIASVSVSDSTMADLETANFADNSLNRNTMTKKSNASSTQPRMPPVTAYCQPGVSASGESRAESTCMRSFGRLG